MSDKNIKIVKVDPSSFFLRKDENGNESIASTSDISDESSVTSISSEGGSVNEANLNPLPSVNPNVSVLKEEFIVKEEPKDSFVKLNNIEEMNEANNYLNTKPAFEPPKLPVNTPFINNTTKNETTTSELSDTISDTETHTETASVSTESSVEDEVIDMSDNALYTVLAALFEDEETGNNVCETLASIDRKLEKHNDVMEKMLVEYTQMNRERSKERRHFEQLSQAISNQNRMLEKLVSVFDVFLSGKRTNNITTKIREDEEEDNAIVGGRVERPSRRLETPENTELYNKIKKHDKKSDRVSVSKEGK